MAKEVKVKLCCPENDSYVELWKAIEKRGNRPTYYGRYTYMDEGTWYYVSDPLGYCERSHPVEKDTTFILCDKNGNECCRYANGEPNPLLKFETYVLKQWDRMSNSISVFLGNEDLSHFVSEATQNNQENLDQLTFRQWLLSFKDPEIYGKEIEEMYGYDDNWIWSRCKEISCEPIPGTEFSYLSQGYQISKIQMQHTVCGVTWSKICCTDAPAVYDEIYRRTDAYHLFGYVFDQTNVGPMYDETTAVKLVSESFRSVYSLPNDFNFYLIQERSDYQTLDIIKLSSASKRLLGSNFRKTVVDRLCKEIRKTDQNEEFRLRDLAICPRENVFREKLSVQYPDIPSWSW